MSKRNSGNNKQPRRQPPPPPPPPPQPPPPQVDRLLIGEEHKTGGTSTIVRKGVPQPEKKEG